MHFSGLGSLTICPFKINLLFKKFTWSITDPVLWNFSSESLEIPPGLTAQFRAVFLLLCHLDIKLYVSYRRRNHFHIFAIKRCNLLWNSWAGIHFVSLEWCMVRCFCHLTGILMCCFLAVFFLYFLICCLYGFWIDSFILNVLYNTSYKS